MDRRARRAARRLSRADSAPLAAHSKEAKEATEVTGDHADIEVEPDQPLWVCPACAVEQKFAPKKQCPCCMLPIKVAARAEKPTESAEAVAAAVNRYQQAIDALTEAGTGTLNEKAIISAYKAKIALLQKPAPLAPEPPPSERHHAAMVAVETAQKRTDQVHGRIMEVELALERKKRDLQQLARALAAAQQDEQAALAACEAAQRAFGPAAAPAVVHATSAAAPEPTLLETLLCATRDTLLRAGGENVKKDALMAHAEKVLNELASHMQTEMMATASPLPTAAAAAPGVARVPPARPAAAPASGGAEGESRLPDRNSIKAGSLSETSRTQATKESHGKAQVVEERAARIALKRREIEDLTAEAEAESDAEAAS